MRTKLSLLGILFVLTMFIMAGCSGDDGVAGTPGAKGADATVDQIDAVVDARLASTTQAIAAAQPESCSVCHAGIGDKHQAVYNQYSDTSAFTLTIDSVTSVPNADPAKFDATMTFTIKKDGLAYIDADGLPSLDQKRFYSVTYDSATRMFTNSKAFSNPIALGGGQYSVTATAMAYAPELSNAEVYAYIGKGKLTTEGMQLYGDVSNAGKAYGDVGTYTSAANVAGCEKCHGKPYMKHGYRAAAVTGLPDFASCKNCHYDTRNGGHQDWQLLVDAPAQYAAYYAQIVPTDSSKNSVTDFMTTAEKTKYAYTANVMNDVHMSHAMEFPYPQSMANCATCHEGKLAVTTTDANFKLATCKSCHPVTGPTSGTDPHRAPALAKIIPHGIPFDEICNTCHKAGGIAPAFSTIHTGYDKKIYADAAGTKYSSIFKTTIDSASLSGNILTINFSATKTGGAGSSLTAADIRPTVMVGLYGYNTKDFIVSPHSRSIDTARDLEWEVGTTNARFTTVSAGGGSWVVTADLSPWASKIADGTVKRAEIAVMPKLGIVVGEVDTRTNGEKDDTVYALNAPSRTFDLGKNVFDDTFFSDIVDVANGCNTCHDALATTFHDGDRGGNIKVCRMCHTPENGGYHLEMQSRSIDSYVHAVHSFQAFDTFNLDLTDPVAKVDYEHHIEHVYPNFTIKNCESCHKAGTYNVPDQSKSLPGVLSKAATWKQTRNIGAVPSYVAGPASRACGGCHRAHAINEDKAGELAAFNQHTKSNGFLVEATDSTVFDSLVTKIMGMFK